MFAHYHLVRPCCHCTVSALNRCSLASTHRHVTPFLSHTFASESREDDDSATGWPFTVASSDTLTHLKSGFQAHATNLPLSYPDTVSAGAANVFVHTFLAHLENAHPRTRRATHAIWAWRASASSGRSALTTSPIPSGAFDGGESGAGDRLARLLELARCEDVILVVFRWYGGVKLRSDRWKCISDVAKEALSRGGFSRHGATKDDGKQGLEGEQGRRRGRGKSSRR